MTNSRLREQLSSGKHSPPTHSLNELSDVDWYLLGLVDTQGVSSKKLLTLLDGNRGNILVTQ